MSYIFRNQSGEITGVARWPNYTDQERLPEDDPELVTFLNRPEKPPITKAEILDAMKQIATATGITTAQKSKLTALIARLP
ncbi:MAG: hypothetical protein V3W44_08585 [Dehalococcoidales bacterium]